MQSILLYKYSLLLSATLRIPHGLDPSWPIQIQNDNLEVQIHWAQSPALLMWQHERGEVVVATVKQRLRSVLLGHSEGGRGSP